MDTYYLDLSEKKVLLHSYNRNISGVTKESGLVGHVLWEVQFWGVEGIKFMFKYKNSLSCVENIIYLFISPFFF